MPSMLVLILQARSLLLLYHALLPYHARQTDRARQTLHALEPVELASTYIQQTKSRKEPVLQLLQEKNPASFSLVSLRRSQHQMLNARGRRAHREHERHDLTHRYRDPVHALDL